MTASYELRFSASFSQDLRKIERRLIPWIVKKTLDLEKNPRSAHTRKLRGTADEYRLRIGDYRVFYTIDDKKKVVIVYHIAHRKDAYR